MKDNPPDDARLEAGLALLREIELELGNEHGLLHGMRVHAPAFKRHVIEMFGDFFGPGQTVERNTKLLLAVALAAQGEPGNGLLEFHIGAALKAGWRREQIIETLELGALFSGWQGALGAVQVAVKTFEKCPA